MKSGSPEDTKPQTLPAKGPGTPELEKKTLEFWEARKIFEKSLEKTKKKKPFTFYDGPPFATGLPHYGHILASTIKDVIPRYQTMRGRYVRRRWGWDCHGLPIEEIVERKLGISGKKQIEEVGIKKFNETCRSMVLGYVEEWRKMVRRIARWVEFDDSYKTMDADYMESVWWAFKEIHKKKLVYEGRKVLLYCPRCETPVSNFEVAMDNSYKDVTEESVYVKFKLKPGQKIGDFTTNDKTYILSWTTTPWTLPANVALAVGENILYTPFTLQDPGAEQFLYIVAEALRPNVTNNLGPWKIPLHTGQFRGSELVGLEYEPLFDVPAVQSEKSYKVYAADFVTTTEGTGIVHTAVVYGEDDYQLGLREGLPIVPMLDEKGKFTDVAPKALHGVYFKDAEKFIKDDLQKRGLLFKRQSYTHSYPHCWRCGTALFYNAIPAWFINIQKIKPKLLASNKKELNWFPEHLKNGRYAKSVEAAPDWNISRNRYWGNPIPAWKCSECKRVEVVGSLKELSEKAGGPKNRYWVMRHGEGENNVLSILDSGQRNLHLTPTGRDQAAASAARFKKLLDKQRKKIDLVIASDIVRTRETAEIAANAIGDAPIHYDKRLQEIHLGPKLNGCHDGEYHKKYPTYESKFENRPEGGESIRDLRARVWDFLKDCEAKYEGKNILLVTHEYCAWLLQTVAEGWSEKRTIIEKEQKGPRFIGFAEIRAIDVQAIPRNDLGEADMHRPYIDEVTFPCPSCKATMARVPEIFDSWVEAGSMPFAESHYPFEHKKAFEGRFPAQFVAEYIAQTRAWFYVMHVISFILFGKAPFENVVTTGTILAEDGSKMSKSKENFPDPWLVLEKYGADSLRFYLMNSVVMQADNLNFSERSVETVHRKVSLLIWNVYNFFSTYVGNTNIAAAAKQRGKKNILDAWLDVRTGELCLAVSNFLDAYDTVRATRAIQEYVDDLSTWYLRRSRKRKDAGPFFGTLHRNLLTASKAIAPIMPFLAEELYTRMRGYYSGGEKAESVHLTDWPVPKFSMDAKARKKLTESMAEVRRLASAALAKRAGAAIKVRQPLQKVTVKSARVKLGKEFLEILADEVNVKEVFLDPKISDEVELDTAITPALREEGLVREAVRMFQELRQKAGLAPKDEIVAMMELLPEMKSSIAKNEMAFKKEIGAKLVEYKRSEKFQAEEITKSEDREIWIGLRKV